MNKQKIRWDDLEIVLAIAKTGSLSGASRILDVAHATVFRWLNEMERDLGVKLFQRGRNGYAATPIGHDLAESAMRVENEILGAERRVVGQDRQLAGTIRLTTTDTLYLGLLAGFLAAFRKKYPEVRLEVVISNQQKDLSRREADIAVRPTNSPPEALVGRQIGIIKQAVYGQKQQWHELESEMHVSDLQSQQWMSPDPSMGDKPMESWMAKNVPESNCRYRIDSVLAMQTAVCQGDCLAILPCYIGDVDEHLHRLTQPIPELETGLWVLTHWDSKRVTRINRLMKEMFESIKLT
ncbi:LysR family transcriptional regulator [Salinispirillum marinum]|uniref:LysR family transcriptional regulator n=2 Tax=Saccharospirillaceae TaxID=255527 RepID=A0ABV8B9V3_9GAMM